MPLHFLHRAAAPATQRVALFPGTWNPPTIAHVEIARAALQQADEVVWVLPQAFPHKAFEGPGFEQRCRMLQAIVSQTPGFSAATSEGGLYAEIAGEARRSLGERPEIVLVLGRDAAERIAAWDYGQPGFFEAFIRDYKLLVAARRGEFVRAPHHEEHISPLEMESSWDDVSSSEVRRRITYGEDWRALVPVEIAEIVGRIY